MLIIDEVGYLPLPAEAAAALSENRLDVAERILKPHLKDDPFDVRAIRMLAELAARMTAGEVNELVADQISQTGLKVTVKSLEVAQWRTIMRQIKEGEARSDLHLTAMYDPESHTMHEAAPNQVGRNYHATAVLRGLGFAEADLDRSLAESNVRLY